ncbi:Rne/Rng family ribonuclease [Paraburkholderia hayleyella]|uniref:Rne/Rng family ribonuclease n=1 Tax=Paraburkholderia hayleyella TaxID=2152889 RepID=UPI0012926B6F|nr:Rne/Rng family ribonuclease [Paraburkholderia hayleyella]
MKRMLFNATQQEELRVAIVDGQKLIDIDIETAGREQRKGNIYKGIVTRIEPSLEACFVNYGEDRHGFLPFKEVARQYFRDGAEVRSARIQDALREGQELIVQVEKEERGNKGAALTTFISLAGRYLVLMPNNPRGGGVSRRIEGDDRQELRETMGQLQLPEGMSIIARTAGIGRSAEELQWDLNYLMQLWRAIESASQSGLGGQPMLIYLESSLVIRAIRDYFQPDIGEILIDTTEIHDQARAFMDIVMPDNVGKVKRYHDDVPLFSRFQIEHQIETAYSRTVPLPSGGAIVIDHTEALVAVDVNSARATKGADIEETAARTNLEAADEVARQLRLRDLGGLIVIDFIDMDSPKSQREVEQRLKDALRHDRARVQMGKISRFGLMELSRQRLRPALSEGSHVTCPRCNGTGHIRDTESSALQVLRIIQEEAMKEHTAAIHCQVPVEVTAFLLNEKRAEINKIEARFKVNVVLIPNKHLDTPHYKLERLRHDDARLDDPRASWKMAEEAARELESDTGYTKRAEDVKPKQEAAVKGITPEKPAPGAAVRPAPAARPATPAGGGFIGWLKQLFGITTTEPAPATPAAQSKSGRPARERGGERSGERNRNRRNSASGNRDTAGRSENAAPGGRQGQTATPRREERETREGREGRENREPREARETREGREPREGREAREGREPREGREREARAGRETREPREGREPRERDNRAERGEATETAARGERRERGERGERGERRRQPDSAEVAASSQTGQTPAEMAESALLADQETVAREGEERRRRRRGRRGGRRERDEEGVDQTTSFNDMEDDAPHAQEIQPQHEREATSAEPDSAAVITTSTATPGTVSVLSAEAPAQPQPVRQQPEPLTRQVSAPPPQAAPVVMQQVTTMSAAVVFEEVKTVTAQPAVTKVTETMVTETVATETAVTETVAAPATLVPAPVPAPVAVAAPVQPEAASAVAATPVTAFAPVAPVAIAPPPAAAPVVTAPLASAPAPAPAPAPVAPAAAVVDTAALQPVLESAGLVWVNTDVNKLRAAAEASAQIVRPSRVPRERKRQDAVDSTPMQQIETGGHSQ